MDSELDAWSEVGFPIAWYPASNSFHAFALSVSDPQRSVDVLMKCLEVEPLFLFECLVDKGKQFRDVEGFE